MICPDCKGEGVVLVEELRLLTHGYARFAEPDYREVEMPCETCGGWGDDSNDSRDLRDMRT